ncbi:hypothetical protein [Alienimonas chondri]|uniref:Uncharacterized protein n=1 Tax=Alienimonas chondri TaxID=2681879 RepID=A0ABX1VDW3_9PLAN|nr:hypothetical protein [Alienimonas chondri]NNJ25457.1 hypothetical protein [Alienimonas chondri]
MLPLALLLTAAAFDDALPAAATLPGAVRVEVTETSSKDGGPEVVLKESIEATVAPDGTFQAQVVDDDRTRSFSGTVETTRSRFGESKYSFQLRYYDVTLNGSVPSGPNGETRPIYDMDVLETFLSIDEFGKPIVCGGSRTSSEDESGTAIDERIVLFTALAEPTPHQLPGSELKWPSSTLPVPAP